jgi:hypothetical protein
MDAKARIAFRLAREDGYSYPNSLHYLMATVEENARESRETFEAMMEEFSTFAFDAEPARTAGKRANRDRESS